MSSKQKLLALIIPAILFLASGCASTPSVQQEPLTIDTPPVTLEDKARDNLKTLALPPLKHPISVSLHNAGLIEACEKIAKASRVGIAIDNSVDPAGITVEIEAAYVPAEIVVEWLARIARSYYIVDDNKTVFLTREPGKYKTKTVSRSYAVGTLTVLDKPVLGRFDNSREKKNLLEALNALLKHVSENNPGCNLVLDDTGSALHAQLPPRGQELLAEALEELKRPKKYVPPEKRDNPLDNVIKADLAQKDISYLLAELSAIGDCYIGCDASRIPPQKRIISLELGETTLGAALKKVAEQAGLGDIAVESGRRIWILAKDEPKTFLDQTGRPLSERAVVRSYFIGPLVEQYGFELIAKKIMSEVTPGLWGGSLPYSLYHYRTGRLIVVHSPEHQDEIADFIDQIYSIGRPRRDKGDE